MGFPISLFTAFVSNAPLADTPGGSDMLALIQGKLTKRLPINQIPGLTPIITVPTTFVTGSAYSILTTDYMVAVNRSPGGATVLQLPGSAGTGRPVIIKDYAGNVSETNSITIQNGTIDGASSYVITEPYGAVVLESMGGSNWSVVSAYKQLEAVTLVTAGASYSATLADRFIGVNKSAGSNTAIVLPSTPPPGLRYTIKDVNGDAANHPITISNGTVDGVSGYILPFAYGSLVIEAIGSANIWSIVSRMIG